MTWSDPCHTVLGPGILLDHVVLPTWKMKTEPLSFVPSSVVPWLWNAVRAVSLPTRMVFSLHEVFSKNYFQHIMAHEYAFKGLQIFLGQCWSAVKVKAARKFSVSLSLPLGSSHGHWDVPSVLSVRVKPWIMRVHFPEPEPQPCFLCKYKQIWGGKVVIRDKLRAFFTHRRDEQSPNAPNNMFRVILISQKGFAPLFPGKQLCLQGNNSKKVPFER